MPNLVRLEELLPVLETVLQEGGEITFTPRGNSMRPMLKGGVDVITLTRFNRPLKKYALPLYRRENGQLVLHRVRHVVKDGYLMCGDNQTRMEFVPFSWVFGVMTAYYRDEKEHSLRHFGYRCYVRLYCGAPLWLRRAFLYCVRLPRRVLSKLRRMFSKK